MAAGQQATLLRCAEPLAVAVGIGDVSLDAVHPSEIAGTYPDGGGSMLRLLPDGMGVLSGGVGGSPEMAALRDANRMSGEQSE